MATTLGQLLPEEEKIMSTRKKIKYIHEGQYVAEVEVELIESDEAWSPYLTVDDAYHLDDLRNALRRGDLEAAVQHGRIYELRPIARA
jgi:hypothetical protein